MSASGVYDLTDVKVVGYQPGEDGALGAVQVQTLDGGGSTQDIYVWLDFTDDDAGVIYYGWYNGDTYEALESGVVTTAVGEGLWSVTMASGLSLQASGEVATAADIPLALPADGLTIANPTPVTVDLINCYVNGYDAGGDGALGAVQVQTLDGGGSTVDIYVWLDFTDDDAGVTYYGWYNGDTYEPLTPGTVTVAPGEGLWSVTMADDLNFVWPKVDL